MTGPSKTQTVLALAINGMAGFLATPAGGSVVPGEALIGLFSSTLAFVFGAAAAAAGNGKQGEKAARGGK